MSRVQLVKQNDSYRRVLEALSLKRRNPSLSLTMAAQQSGTTLRTVRRYAGAALSQQGRRVEVKRSDRLPRHMRILTDRGEVDVLVRGSRPASEISRHNNAVRFFLVTGSAERLEPFIDRIVKALDGKQYPFVTDTRTLNRLARAGAVHFPDIYAMESRP